LPSAAGTHSFRNTESIQKLRTDGIAAESQNWIQKEKTTGMTKNKDEENEVLDLKCGTIRQQ
jgi:hypothetical protein